MGSNYNHGSLQKKRECIKGWEFFRRLRRRKCKHFSYDQALQAVEGIRLEEGKKREANSLFEHRSYDSVQRQQREKLVENEHDPVFISSRFEVNGISRVKRSR